MHDLANIYLCDNCGEVDGRYHEEVDTDRDEVYAMYICAKCNVREVRPKLDDNGNPCYRRMSEDEIIFLQCFNPEDFYP